MIGEMQIPVRKVMPWQDDVRQKVGGSNVGAGKSFFLVKSAFKCTYKSIMRLNL